MSFLQNQIVIGAWTKNTDMMRKYNTLCLFLTRSFFSILESNISLKVAINVIIRLKFISSKKSLSSLCLRIVLRKSKTQKKYHAKPWYRF